MLSSQPVLQLSQAEIHQEDHVILQGVNLELHAGDFMYLIGSTGSGKSSLLKTLYADLPLTQGEGNIAGFNLKNLKQSDIPMLRRSLGIVFQDFQLLMDRSIFHNLEFVLRATGQKDKASNADRIHEVLKRVGMGTKEHKMPYALSGGEQQRVAIARALLNKPPLILADEPTGNLDPHTSEEIMHLMEEISASGSTILMATHDYSLLLKFPHPTVKCAGGTLSATVQRTL
ncbi:MAG: ATP-binding cassette domain-containing protein [Flavobacteriales bacterium]|jgi:cell division transport system ATP-binding protein|nr:ATP-binding cassette domain-containing protein [Flavobacteriales bacterium]NCF57407.1 ATP-binding cassette domain-containing protein [Bacteroidota bacterium]NCG44554.1 ATP-binding cassette domain-containing protein [Pseudomonadota bacterium]MBT3572197.1 ATP-binding cassette domain-containing protein [Flavobacteriales bacterium]MBT3678240.1 ATP-binding cassette domain-containing protein [Flavobacteriales bacterium]